jgi:hypothetical protein
MITIFCDFCQFSAQKIDVFLKKHCYDQFFSSKFGFIVSQKRHFLLNFSAKIFLKIITSVPGSLVQVGGLFSRPSPLIVQKPLIPRDSIAFLRREDFFICGVSIGAANMADLVSFENPQNARVTPPPPPKIETVFS